MFIFHFSIGCIHVPIFFVFSSSTLFRVGGACSLILGVNTLYKLTHPCKYCLLFDRGWLLISLCFRFGLPINQLIRQQDDHERASVGLFASPTFGPRSVCMLGKGYLLPRRFPDCLSWCCPKLDPMLNPTFPGGVPPSPL